MTTIMLFVAVLGFWALKLILFGFAVIALWLFVCFLVGVFVPPPRN